MEKLITIPIQELELEGTLKLPENTEQIVLFAHGSGSSRLSPRNNYVANALYNANLGSLLIDLLSAKEDQTYETRFDIDLLTERLMHIVKWLQKYPQTHKLKISLFGSSTGAAAALKVAALLGNEIHAVVSRGGRPDLAIPNLNNVTSPTLLIVGGNDFGVIELNQTAYDLLTCKKSLEIIPGATHLFEERGALEKVSSLAANWFK